jgi:hypothetical protein
MATPSHARRQNRFRNSPKNSMVAASMQYENGGDEGSGGHGGVVGAHAHQK